MAPSTSKAQPPRRSARLASNLALKLKSDPKSPSVLRALFPRHSAGVVRNLPPKPSSICDACWQGPFAAYLGLFHPPLQENEKGIPVGGYSYFISKSQMKHGIDAGCAWCNYVLSRFSTFNFRRVRGWPTGCMKITLGVQPDRQKLILVKNGGKLWCETPITTSIGGFTIHEQPNLILIYRVR